MSSEKKYEIDSKPKKKRLTCKSIIETFYDKEDGTFFTRTCKDWAYLLIFFILFYAVLFGYFALLIYIFINGIMTPNVPFRTGSNSLIGAMSSLSFRPVMDNTNNILAVSFKNNSQSLGKYINSTNAYLSATIPQSRGSSKICNSSLDGSTMTDVCFFDVTKLGPCSTMTSAYLNSQRLCIYLRINNIYGWVPSIQNRTDSSDILVSCTGQNDADVPNVGQLAYYPNAKTINGTFGVFPTYFYPFLNQSTYWPPVVAVEFQNITKNTMVYISCSTFNVNNILGSTSLVIMASNM